MALKFYVTHLEINNMRNLKTAALVATPLLAASMSNAHAVSLVTAEVTGQITDVNTDQVAIGALVIASAAIAFGINWLKATFF